MIEQFLAIARNTFFESIRQPIVLVVLVIAAIALILANPLSAFTMEDDQRMLIDMGLATIFLCGALLASLVATGVLTREIENKTALTVISKPVGRPLFIVGKFVGVAGALMLCTLFMSFIFLLAELHSVLQTVRDPYHLPVIVFGVGAGVLGLLAAVWCNYFYHRVFTSTVICLTTPLLALAYAFSLMFNHDFTPQAIGTDFRPDLWIAIIALAAAIIVLTAIAIAVSTRFGQMTTLAITLGIFVAGMLSNHYLGREIDAMRATWLDRLRLVDGDAHLRSEMFRANNDFFEDDPDRPLTVKQEVAVSFTFRKTGEVATETRERELPNTPGTAGDWLALPDGFEAAIPGRPGETQWIALAPASEKLGYRALWAAFSIVPNFQLMWLSDAITQGRAIPLQNLASILLYAAAYIGVSLSAAIILFQTREVG